jgi:hypothetical protein
MFSIFKGFTKRAENEFGFKIKIRCDIGSEFENCTIKDYCDEKMIKHDFSTKYTPPQQNRVVKKGNQTLIDMIRSMLLEYNISQFFNRSNQHAYHASNKLYYY